MQIFLFLEERQLAEGDDVFSRDAPGDGGGGGDGSSGHSDSDADGDGGVAIRGKSILHLYLYIITNMSFQQQNIENFSF